MGLGRLYQLARERLQARADVPEVQLADSQLWSANRVTGLSWNVTIARTCAPTSVCSATCYALRPSSPITWSGSERLQDARLRLVEADPEGTAYRLAREALRVRAPFVVINGAGDLTPAAVRMVNRLAQLLPVPISVRSRRPREIAGLDRDSLHRREALLRMKPRAHLWFSYQGAKDEVVGSSHGCALVFADGYRAELLGDAVQGLARCPLHLEAEESANRTEVLDGACARCRRCLDGTLVREQARLDGRPPPELQPAPVLRRRRRRRQVLL
jgi:hypothetical protein